MKHVLNRNLIFTLLLASYGACTSSMARGASYYMRADGTADDKTEATSCTDASTAMSVETHNEETFQPGDIVNLCDGGGEYKTTIAVPSSGSDGNPITYKNADGDTPTIDLSMDVGGATGWTDMGGGVYRKKGYGRVLWEDDEPLKAASSESCSDGNWYYPIGSHLLYYKPTTGTPADHSIRTLWFKSGWSPYAIDLRNRNNITVYGITINRTGGGISHGQKKTSPTTPIRNIVIHDNTINKCMWAIWSQVYNNSVESDVKIFDNNIDHCNSGISAWAGSDSSPGHTQHHARYSVTGNKILNLNSISNTLMWSDALLKGYYYKDHEGISFQNVQDSIIEGNTITTTFRKDMTSDHYWCRAIYLYLTNGDSATTGNSILRNYISGHFYPAIYMSTAKGFEGLEDNIVAYNVIHYGLADKGHISFGLSVISDNPLTGDNYFVNNTIINNKVGLGMLFRKKMTGNWIVRNNIIQSKDFVHITAWNNEGNLTFDHNMYTEYPSSKWGFMVITSGIKFKFWKNRYNYDTIGSITANPLFVSPEKDFHLKPGSLAIDAGVPVGFNKDYDGVPIFNKPDIGAYEFQPRSNSRDDSESNE